MYDRITHNAYISRVLSKYSLMEKKARKTVMNFEYSNEY